MLVQIPVQKLASLLKSENELIALENYGVDNWIGYGDHRTAENDYEDLSKLTDEEIVKKFGYEIIDNT